MSLKRVSIMWIDGRPETARVVHWWTVPLYTIQYPVQRITTWTGLTSDKRDPIDIARQMDEFMRVRRLYR
jgi:hypothetical protein